MVTVTFGGRGSPDIVVRADNLAGALGKLDDNSLETQIRRSQAAAGYEKTRENNGRPV